MVSCSSNIEVSQVLVQLSTEDATGAFWLRLSMFLVLLGGSLRLAWEKETLDLPRNPHPHVTDLRQSTENVSMKEVRAFLSQTKAYSSTAIYPKREVHVLRDLRQKM